MLTIEFHCHTIASKDSLTRPDVLIRTARKKGLDRLVVTDHNSIRGALAAQKLEPELIIVGEEIMTTRGELLAAFVQEEIPAGLSPEETIQRLRDQGAFISVSHPYDTHRKGGWREADLLEIIPHVDAIEVFNSRCMDPRFNQRAQAFAEQHNLAVTVGSDAHAPFEIGRSVMVLESFANADGLRSVIRSAECRTRLSSPLVHFASRYATIRKRWGKY